MFSFFNNIPGVTKNLLLINVLFYLASHVLLNAGIVNLFTLFSSHYVGTPMFQPFQIVTHMFMHSGDDFMHILFNMIILVVFGGMLERHWGAKKFFIFYILCGVGAFALENIYFGLEVYRLKQEIVANGFDLYHINDFILNFSDHVTFDNQIGFNSSLIPYDHDYGERYVELGRLSGLGASGALFGVLAAFAMLFPNTQLMLLFPPIPVKAKYLIGIYIVYELYQTFSPGTNDNINHLAHISGAAIGLAYVLINRKFDRTNFY